jgi:glycopeptide antibiotics resistance protein
VSRRVRLVYASLLVAYVLFLVWVLGKADPGTAASVVGWVSGLVDAWGAPAAITERARVEMALNAAMFTPVALLGALTFPDHPWANWVVYGFVGSVAMEVVQALWLPLRSAQYVDIVANTAGMLAGAVLSLLVAEAHKFRPTSTISER